jgi:hypothetical protein
MRNTCCQKSTDLLSQIFLKSLIEESLKQINGEREKKLAHCINSFPYLKTHHEFVAPAGPPEHKAVEFFTLQIFGKFSLG